MSELFDEVDEDVRRDQLKKLWDQYSIYIIAGALLIGIVAVVLGWPFVSGRRLKAGVAMWVAALGLVAVTVAVWDLIDVLDRVDDIQSDGLAVASVGTGLYLVAAGAVAVMIGGAMECFDARARRRADSWYAGS